MSAVAAPVLLLLGPLPPSLVEALSARHTVVLIRDPDAETGLRTLLRRTEIVGLVTSARTGASREWIEGLPALRVVSVLGAGLDRVDLEAARERGIAVGYTPGVADDCVADLAFGMVIELFRGIGRADRFVRQGQWLRRSTMPLGRRVSGARLGIVGLGRIGLKIAHRAQAFDMEVAYTNRSPRRDVAFPFVATVTELAGRSDVVVLAAAVPPGMPPLVGAAELAALGPDGFLVNVARGSLVDEAALVSALVDRRIAGAGLDVFANEPQVPEILFDLDNAVLSPHMAGATRETQQALVRRVVENLDAFLTTGTVLSDAIANAGERSNHRTLG